MRQGDRSSYVAGDNAGAVITGDGNTVVHGSRP
jgi:hypothetical protein